MRKHSPRKWLHAILDLLPVILIPVFMVYSHRHTIDDYTVVKEESLTVNAYQYSEFGKPYSIDHYTFNNCTGTLNNDRLLVSAPRVNNCSFDIYQNIDLYEHVYYFTFNIFHDNSSNVIVNLYSTDDIIIFEDILCPYGEDTLFYSNITSGMTETQSNFGFYFLTEDEENLDDAIVFSNFQYFDLTEIFGSGNEPTADVFKSYLIEPYYDYGYNTLDVGMHDVTYNDTDIGSQFVYTLYNTTDKYFNFTNVFNLSSVTEWINTNLFKGSMPLMAYTVWYIIVYEFIIDLLFLLYAFFMFLIDFTEYVLEKPFNKVTRC